jgi:hypothetical protein
MDPGSREVRSVDLPFWLSEIGAGPAGVFAIGPPGDGRLAAVSPAGTVTLAPVGRSLRLLAVAEHLVWTVDDAAAAVIALDSESLTPVASFRRLASPYALLARGDSAWYLAAPEVELRAAGLGRQRAIVWSGGPCLDLLRLDAATGEAIRLCQPGGSHLVLDADGIWVSGRTDDPMDQPGADVDLAPSADPVASIEHYDLAGTLLASISVAGQAAELAVHGGELWVSGFRRSRQASVLSVLSQDGTLAGEADLSGVDILPWYTPPEPVPRYAPREFAELTRAATEAVLTGPRDVHGRFGEHWREPPVSPAFSLERVGFRSSPDGYEITVTFRWDGEHGLLGYRHLTEQDDWRQTPEQAAADVAICLEEDLQASGYGLANAIREPRDGVSWLRWDPQIQR